MSAQNRQQSCEISPEPCGDEGESSAPQEESAAFLNATFSALSEVDKSTLSRWKQEALGQDRAEQSALVPAATADPVTPTTHGPQVSPGAGNQGLWPLDGMNMINSIKGDDSTQNAFGMTYSTDSTFHDHYRMGMRPCTQPRYPNTISFPDSSLSPPFRQERYDMSTYQALMSDSPLLESASMAAGPASGYPRASPSNPGGFRPPQEHMLIARPSPHGRQVDTAWFPPRDSSLESPSTRTSGNSRYQAGAPVRTMRRERDSGLSREPAFPSPLSIHGTPKPSPGIVINSMTDRNFSGLMPTPPWSGQFSSGSPPQPGWTPDEDEDSSRVLSTIDPPWLSIWRTKRQTFRTAIIRENSKYLLRDPAAADDSPVPTTNHTRGRRYTDPPEITAVSAWLLGKHLTRHCRKDGPDDAEWATLTAVRRLSLAVGALNLTRDKGEVYARALDLTLQIVGQNMGAGDLPVRLDDKVGSTLERDALMEEYRMPAGALLQIRSQVSSN